MSTLAKKTKGRQKIEMTKILDEKSLAVTFSKRQSGIVNKFTELSTLCGVQFATVIFSPTKKPLSYGVPTPEAIINRYLEQLPPPNLSMPQHMELQQLNRHLTDINAKMQGAKKTSKELDLIKKAMQDRNWQNAPIETLEVRQLEELKALMLDLKNNAEQQAERLSVVEGATTSTPTILGFGSTGADGAAGPSK